MSVRVYNMEASQFLAMRSRELAAHNDRLCMDSGYAQAVALQRWSLEMAMWGSAYTGDDVYQEISCHHCEHGWPSHTRHSGPWDAGAALAWDEPGRFPKYLLGAHCGRC